MSWPSIDRIGPLIEQISLGAVAGFAVGFALKKLGKLVAVAVGLVFLTIQILAFYGFVTVNWGEVERQVEPLFGGDSLERAWGALLGLLTFNLPFAASFVPGLILGLRRG